MTSSTNRPDGNHSECSTDKALRPGLFRHSAAAESLCSPNPGFTALHRIITQAGEELTLEEHNAAVLHAAMMVMGADGASLHVVNDSGGDVRTTVAYFDNHTRYDMSFADTLCQRVLTTGQRQIIPDMAVHAGLGPPAGLAALQTTPIQTRAREVIGGITTSWGHPYTPSTDQLQLLDILARHVADSLEYGRTKVALHAGEERLKTVIAELQHRVRNILAVVRSVFSLTVASGGDFQTTIDHFNGRLDALARTQVIITRSIAHSIEGTIDLETMLRDELLGAGVHDGPRVHIAGPDVALVPGIAESIGLAIHELTTNALKYGALAQRDATLAISWRVIEFAPDKQLLDFLWRESGIDAPVNPVRQGFGRELIEQALAYRLDATTSLTFGKGEVECRLLVPLTEATKDTVRKGAWA